MTVIYQYAKLHTLNSNGSLTAIKLETTHKVQVIATSVKVPQKINYHDKDGIAFLKMFHIQIQAHTFSNVDVSPTLQV